MGCRKNTISKDNLAKRAIIGAKTSAHDFMINIVILLTEYDFLDIELIIFNTSSTEGALAYRDTSVFWINTLSVSVCLKYICMTECLES